MNFNGKAFHKNSRGREEEIVDPIGTALRPSYRQKSIKVPKKKNVWSEPIGTAFRPNSMHEIVDSTGTAFRPNSMHEIVDPIGTAFRPNSGEQEIIDPTGTALRPNIIEIVDPIGTAFRPNSGEQEMIDPTGTALRPSKRQMTIKVPKKRSQWSDADSQLLLELWAERSVDLRRTKRNGHVYKDIAASMGHKFTAEEVHVKIRNFTQKYRDEKKLMGPSGGSPSNWLYYPEVHQIIGSNAANNAPIIESCTAENSTDAIFQPSSEVVPTASSEVDPTASTSSSSPSVLSPLDNIPSSSGRKRNNLGEIVKMVNTQNMMLESVVEDTHLLTNKLLHAINVQNENSTKFLKLMEALVDKI